MTILSGAIIDNLLLVDTNPSSFVAIANTDQLQDLHLKLGHAGVAQIERYLNHPINAKIKDEFHFPSCDKSKITRATFNQTSTKASKIFEQIHVDLMGPINPTAKGGYRFILTLVDNYSR